MGYTWHNKCFDYSYENLQLSKWMYQLDENLFKLAIPLPSIYISPTSKTALELKWELSFSVSPLLLCCTSFSPTSLCLPCLLFSRGIHETCHICLPWFPSQDPPVGHWHVPDNFLPLFHCHSANNFKMPRYNSKIEEFPFSSWTCIIMMVDSKGANLCNDNEIYRIMGWEVEEKVAWCTTLESVIREGLCKRNIWADATELRFDCYSWANE